MLNHAWTYGAPSGRLESAGVLVHTFDQTERESAPWWPCDAPNAWCYAFRDRLCASLANARQPRLVTQKSTAGLVLSPSIPLLCSYPSDGGTMEKLCTPPAPTGCVPGCSAKGSGEPQWCAHAAAWSTSQSAAIWDCAFRPTDLEAMLRHHAQRFEPNEVVVDTSTWARDLPELVVAIVFLVGSGLSGRQLNAGERQARDVHARMLAAFPQRPTPLVTLDLRRAEGAFTLLWPHEGQGGR